MAIPEDCTNDGAAFVTGCDHYTTGVSQAQLVPSLRGWNCVQDLYMPLRDTCRPVVPSAPLYSRLCLISSSSADKTQR